MTFYDALTYTQVQMKVARFHHNDKMAEFMPVPQRQVHRPRYFREHVSPLLTMNDDELRARYRFGAQAIRYIANLPKEELTRPTKRNHAMDAEAQVSAPKYHPSFYLQ
jgi:hypothetical protein